jgi:hypothetical protein
MRAKAIPVETHHKKRFFLLMIAPLLIGLMISLSSFAHAEWNTQEDPLLKKSPTQQGWKRIQIYKTTGVKPKTEGQH